MKTARLSACIAIVGMVALGVAGCLTDSDSATSDEKTVVPKSTAAAPDKAAEGAMTQLFGPELTNAKQETVSVDKLAGKTVGIYFSAHWCPPCRAFTPRLVDFYNALQKAGKEFEIIFVSSDRDEKSMLGYMNEAKMPWLALPYGNERKKTLSAKYGVKGIPTLVIINTDGETITTKARGQVQSQGVAAFDEWQ